MGHYPKERGLPWEAPKGVLVISVGYIIITDGRRGMEGTYFDASHRKGG